MTTSYFKIDVFVKCCFWITLYAAKGYTNLQIFIFYNRLLYEFCFPFSFDIYPRTGSYRLPTHRRGTRVKFFPGSLLISKLKFLLNVDPGSRICSKGL